MAFAIMATDSKQLYLISHDHRTKKRKDFGCPSSLFFLSSRRCTGAFEVYLECLAFGLGVFADNILEPPIKAFHST